MQDVVARKIGPKRKGFRGKEPFLRTGDMIHWESYLERDYIRLADFDSNVALIKYQPRCLKFTYLGKKLKYFPDYEVVSVAGQITLVEVKPNKYFSHPKNLVKYEVGKQFCERMGWKYIVVTEDHIRQGYLQQNLSILRAYGFEEVDEKLLISIKAKVAKLRSCYIFELKEELPQISDHDFFVCMYRLIYLEDVLTDLTGTQLTDESFIKINEDIEGEM